MKNTSLFLTLIVSAALVVSCGPGKYNQETYAPEESGLNVMKITDESTTSVFAPKVFSSHVGDFTSSTVAGSKKERMFWATPRLLAVSPEGDQIAFLSDVNKQRNIMTKRTALQGAATQRTFRNVYDFSWGMDDNLYYADFTNVTDVLIASTNAYSGSLIRQLTNNNEDYSPVLTEDGSLLFFTRVDNSGPSIWSLNLKTGALTSCARGYSPAIVPGDNNKFLCVRNSTKGTSEIWLIDYMIGQETLILSDPSRGYSNPVLSPDGQWILCQGNAKSNISRKMNLDIFAVKIDGTQCIQLTYHPAEDCCPAWSADGKSVYFLSARANKKNMYNVWKMRFM